jgi:hypothetical protein
MADDHAAEWPNEPTRRWLPDANKSDLLLFNNQFLYYSVSVDSHGSHQPTGRIIISIAGHRFINNQSSFCQFQFFPVKKSGCQHRGFSHH